THLPPGRSPLSRPRRRPIKARRRQPSLRRQIVPPKDSVFRLTADQWAAVGAGAAAVGAVVSALALWAAYSGLKHNTRAIRIQVLEGVFRDIRELDRQFIASFESMSPS